MPSLSNHQSNEFTKLLIEGDSGCLAGDTVVSVTRGGSKSKIKTLRELHSVQQSAKYNPELETYLLCDLGGYAGLNRMEEIVYSGMKPVYTIRTKQGHIIKATTDHMFNTSDGWLPLSTLSQLSNLFFWRSSRSGTNKKAAPPRVTIFSIQHHPFAQAHVINGGNYKRDQRARLVVEAAMNGLLLDEFILTLRFDALKSATFTYLPRDVDVHHKDENTINDHITNLEVIPRDDHRKLHQQDRVKASKGLELTAIESISYFGEVHTYDIVMDEPYRNFIANGLVVHNSGKTGALTSLVKAGYKLRILDFDNGLDTLKQFVLYECPDKIDNIEFRTLTDKRKFSPEGSIIDGVPKAFTEGTKMLDRWKYKDNDGNETDLGTPYTWGPDTILVIDSLTRMSDAAFEWRLAMTIAQSRGKYDMRAVYGDAQDAVEYILATLYSESFRTNVIVVSHIRYMERQDGMTKGYPKSVGSALSPNIPTYFNSVAQFETSLGGKRTLKTHATALLDLKNPAPFKMEKEYSITTGLADFFGVLRSHPTQTKPQLVRKA